MQLIDCRGRARPSEGAVYIGRKMPRLRCSPLRNPFKLRGDTGDGIALAGKPEAILERYRRHLTWRLTHGYPEPAKTLRALEADSTLACWCVERPARAVLGEVMPAEDHCHGDVVFTVWRGLVELGWDWATADPQHERRAFSAAHAQLYEACFEHPLVWRSQ